MDLMDLGPSRPRTVALLAGGAVLLLAALRWALSPRPAETDPFAGGLERGASWLLVSAAVWLCLVAATLLVEAWCGGRPSATRWCPAPTTLRRLVAISSGAALSVGLAAPVLATPQDGTAATQSSIDGLRLPEVPLTHNTPTTGMAGPSPDAVHHRVVRGDTLWAIAQGQDPEATAAQVAILVDRIHAQNREVIGADPDRLVPGQTLLVPRGRR